MQLIDSHCHLQDPKFDPDRDEVLARAEAACVVALLLAATDLQSAQAVSAMAGKHPQLYASVGVHPHEADKVSGDVLTPLAFLAAQEKVVAIGEIGLDYHRHLTPVPLQQDLLRKLLTLAHEQDLPVILHCRNDETGTAGGQAPWIGASAHQDLFALLSEFSNPPIRGVLHCFSGDLETARRGLDLGLYISFAGNLTFPKAEALRSVAQAIPLDRILLETDAPYLAPQTYRGKRNEPAFLKSLAETLAGLTGVTLEDVARVTTVNAHALFGMGPAPTRGKVTYVIRNSLYVNLTNACTGKCVFCALSTKDFKTGKGHAPFVKGHHLKMERDPSMDQIFSEVNDPSRYEEIVFCGYGEPLLRLETLLAAGRRFKEQGARRIRLDTNGHGNLIHRRSVVLELAAVVDEVSVSLNTADPKQYLQMCRPTFGEAAYDAIKVFVRECKAAGLKTGITAVAVPGVDLEAVRCVATEELKVDFRVRTYNDVG